MGRADGSMPLGLCFGLNWVDGKQVFSYLVTSRHVVEDSLHSGQEISLRANRPDAPSAEASPLPSQWVYHVDPAVDLAVLPRVGQLDGHVTTMAALSSDAIVTPERLLAPLVEGIEVCAIALLDPARAVAVAKLVVRHGHIALVNQAPLVGPYGLAHFYVIECATQPDDSGGPVFMPAQGPSGQPTLALLGVLMAPYPLQGLMRSDAWPRSGLALVTPGQFIIDVLQQPELAELRQQGLGAGRIRQVPPKLRTN